jgi:glycosyltransferase involved in cell wall biosynthesis
LLQAAVRVSRERPDVHYLLVGQRWSDKAESRRFEAELHQWAEARLGGRVHFLGLREDVDRLLREVTMLVHPARQEPLGRVLLEAAASGAAIVATGVGGTCEIFPPDSHAARLVPPDDPERLADAMLELLGDGPLRTRLGDAARRRAMAAFSAEKAAAGLVEHYRQVSSC